MDGLRDYDTKLNKTQKEKYHRTSLICEILKKCIYLQNRNKLTDIDNKLTVTKGETLKGGLN